MRRVLAIATGIAACTATFLVVRSFLVIEPGVLVWPSVAAGVLVMALLMPASAAWGVRMYYGFIAAVLVLLGVLAAVILILVLSSR